MGGLIERCFFTNSNARMYLIRCSSVGPYLADHRTFSCVKYTNLTSFLSQSSSKFTC